MKNKITIAIAIVALMVAALAAPVVMADDNVSYTASVGSEANVIVSSSDGAFGSISAGATYTKSPSINLTNSGNAVGTVTAEFTTSYGTTPTYGMVLDTNTGIPADKLTIDGEIMQNNADPVTLTSVPANDGTNDGTVSYDAVLTVPAGQTPGTYTGNVLLTFGTA